MIVLRFHLRNWSATLFMAAVLFIATAAPARASVCALADHIRSANTNTAVGFCPAGTSHDVITISEDIILTEPLPVITGTITIEGGGHTISGDEKFPIFIVEGGRLTVNNLTMTKGTSNGIIKSWAGAISAHDGELRVNNSRFVENFGSAIVLWRSVSEINSSSFVVNRQRYGSGGAIFVGQGVTLDVNNSTFIANHARDGGSALATRVSTMRGIHPLQSDIDACHHRPQSGSRPGIGIQHFD